MRVLLDANIPHDLRHHLVNHDVDTAHYAGLGDFDDGALLDAMVGRYDVLVTGDGSLPMQQAVAGRPLSVVVVRGRGNKIENLVPLVPALLAVLAELKPGDVRLVTE